ncbi:MAG TPA: LysE family transporter, partial [Anaerolineae bacterium]|nr:LysE family transporter [Anaerolineae bacterium]
MSLFISAFALGLAFVATPGAVTAQAIRRGLERGFRSALSLQLGAMIGLALWAIVAFMGAAVIAQNALARIILGTIGVLLLGQLAWRALRDAYRSTTLSLKPSSTRGDFALGATLSLASPLPVAFWLGIGTGLVSSVNASTNSLGLFVFFAGFMSGALLWCVFLASVIAWGQRFATPRFFRLTN